MEEEKIEQNESERDINVKKDHLKIWLEMTKQRKNSQDSTLPDPPPTRLSWRCDGEVVLWETLKRCCLRWILWTLQSITSLLQNYWEVLNQPLWKTSSIYFTLAGREQHRWQVGWGVGGEEGCEKDKPSIAYGWSCEQQQRERTNNGINIYLLFSSIIIYTNTFGSTIWWRIASNFIFFTKTVFFFVHVNGKKKRGKQFGYDMRLKEITNGKSCFHVLPQLTPLKTVRSRGGDDRSGRRQKGG